MTVFEFMTHTSGFEVLNDWTEALSITLQASVEGIGMGGEIDNEFEEKGEVYFTPGTKILYSDVGMQVVGGIAEKVYGQSWD